MRQRTYFMPRTEDVPSIVSRIEEDGIIGAPDRTLLIASETTPSRDRIASDLSALRQAFPGYQIVGATMVGPAPFDAHCAHSSDLKIREGLELSVLAFETSSFTVLRYDCSIMSLAQAGARFSEDVESIDCAKAALVFAPTNDVNPDLFLTHLAGAGDRLPLFGMVAGHWNPFGDDPCFAIADGRPLNRSLVAVVLHGPDLGVTVDSCSGWRAVGKRMHVTAGTADGCISEIDRMNPIDLYRHYLHMNDGESAYYDACSFPIVVSEGTKLNARLPLLGKDGGMFYGGKSPVGLTVSLGSAYESDLLHSSLEMMNRIARFRPQALLATFCIGRRIFLGKELFGREIRALQQLADSPSIGFGYGEIAHVDNLTGLANRPAVEEWVSAASRTLADGETIEAVMFDLDNFKSINDGFGHDVGDAVLVKVSNAMRHFAYPRSIMGRWGGDEFVFFTAGSSIAHVAAHMEELRQQIAAIDFSPIDQVTLSAGIASMGASDDFRELYKRIDRAMYRSKHLGGNRITVYSSAYRTEISAPSTGHYFSLQERSVYEDSKFPILVYQIVNGGYMVIAVSEGYCEMVRTPRNQIVDYLNGKSFTRIYPADQQRMVDLIDQMKTSDRGTLIYRLLIDGRYHTLLAFCRSQETDDGQTIIIAAYFDLSESRDELRRLLDRGASMEIGDAAQDRKNRHVADYFAPAVRRALEESRFPFAIMKVDEGRYRAVLVSDGACRLYGERRDDLIAYLSNKSYRKTHPDDAGRLMAAARNIGTVPDQSIVCRLKVNGTYHPILFDQKVHYAADGTPLYVVAYIDLSSTDTLALDTLSSYLAGQEDKLLKDEVTGLPNEAFFRTFSPGIVKEMFEHSRRPTAVFVNLRGMHSYNEQHGYEAGDELLARTARALRNEFPSDQPMRFAEDHFVVFSAEDRIPERIDAVNRALARFTENGSEMVVAGAYTLHDPEESPSRAVDRARQAASMIRDNRKKRFQLFDKTIEEHFHMRDYVLNHWHEALAKGWIETYFQPVQGLLSNKISSLEALARWQDPFYGLLPPSVFVPVLEEHHLIWELDLRVLQLACAFQGSRKRRGLPYVPISVNLSRSDFSVPDLHETIASVIAENGLAPRDVAIEITESALVNHEDLISGHIERFHKEGHLVYLDDFGSGYSTLNSLQKFDFDVLKLDMMFLRNATEKTPVILTAAIDMAKRLHMLPLMEGVETEEERAFLRIAGCSRVQGYLISKPLPPAELVSKLDTEGLEPLTPTEDAFFTATARANMTDANVPADGDGYIPSADEHPLFIYSCRKGTVKVLYANEAALQGERLLGCDDLSRVEREMNEGGIYYDLVVKDGFSEALATRTTVFRDLDTPELKTRLRISLLAEQGDLRSFLVVGHDTYVPHAMSPDGKSASYWKFRQLHPGATVDD